jgi:hypothetical protein
MGPQPRQIINRLIGKVMGSNSHRCNAARILFKEIDLKGAEKSQSPLIIGECGNVGQLLIDMSIMDTQHESVPEAPFESDHSRSKSSVVFGVDLRGSA